MKRICALLLCGALLIPQVSAAAAGSWPAWAEEALNWGREASISQEFLSEPEETVTRGMAARRPGGVPLLRRVRRLRRRGDLGGGAGLSHRRGGREV